MPTSMSRSSSSCWVQSSKLVAHADFDESGAGDVPAVCQRAAVALQGVVKVLQEDLLEHVQVLAGRQLHSAHDVHHLVLLRRLHLYSSIARRSEK